MCTVERSICTYSVSNKLEVPARYKRKWGSFSRGFAQMSFSNESLPSVGKREIIQRSFEWFPISRTDFFYARKLILGLNFILSYGHVNIEIRNLNFNSTISQSIVELEDFPFEFNLNSNTVKASEYGMKQTKRIYCESSKDSEKCIFFHKAHNVENMKYGTDSVRLSVRWGV